MNIKECVLKGNLLKNNKIVMVFNMEGEFSAMLLLSNLYKINQYGLRATLLILRSRLLNPLLPYLYNIKWRVLSSFPNFYGLNYVKRKEDVIVSLTSFPKRIDIVHHCIRSLMMQSVKADKIILWLAKEQFPNGEIDLPYQLKSLVKYGLSIKWCSDIKSFKKLIPTLRLYPDAVIITTDDDMLYNSDMIERLVCSYQKYPDYIHCHRVTKISIDNGEIKAIAGGYDYYRNASYLNKLTGCSGVCYPPHSLYKDILNSQLFMELTPTNDDIWFWLMGVLNGTRCKVVHNNYAEMYYIKNSQKASLSSVNDYGENLFWKQFNNMLDYYPELYNLLECEFKKENCIQ